MADRVVLDAGHGGKDPGAVNGSRNEKDDVLRLALAVEERLLALGIQVTQTRRADLYVSLADRTGLANRLGADLFVSLHRNGYTETTARGTEVWTYTTPGDRETAIAQSVQKALREVGISADRGVKKGNYHVLRETDMPAVLIELGFISNKEDNELFDARLEAYADAIATAVGGHLSTTPATAEPTAREGVLYRVQVGAFANRENALGMQKTLMDNGFTAIIVQSST